MSPDAPPRRRTRPPASTWTRHRLLVGDERRHGEHGRRAGRRDAASTKAREVGLAAPRVHRRDQHPASGPPGRDLAKLASDAASVFTMNSTSRSVKRARAPLHDRALRFVDDHDERPDAGGAEVSHHRLDQRTPAMGTIGFGTAKPAARTGCPRRPR